MDDEDPEAADPDAAEARPQSEEPSGFPWALLAIPAVAMLVLVAVLLAAAQVVLPSSVHPSLELVHVVVVGGVILVVLLIVEAVLLTGGHPDHLEDEAEPAPGPERPAARDDTPDDQPAEGDLETVATEDEVEGREVLEMARPPKGGVDAGVYSTTYVEIDKERVLRVEELVAERQRGRAA
jgi:hypothetical protein